MSNQHFQNVRMCQLKRALVALSLIGASTVISIGPVPAHAQSSPGPCKVNGVLVDPPLPPGVAQRWLFIANFDHPKSATDTVTCLVIKTATGTTYDVGTHHCTVVATSNPSRRRFGSGVARFDGDAYLQCTINPTPPPLDPPNVWVYARVNIPTALTTTTNTLVTSDDIDFNVQSDPTCAWTLNSRYDAFAFSHATTGTCGSFASIESHLLNGANGEGRHRVTIPSGTTFYGPTAGNVSFAFSPVFSFRIGAQGETFTLDYVIIDPDSVKCCSGI
jgi:hypothetical protein